VTIYMNLHVKNLLSCLMLECTAVELMLHCCNMSVEVMNGHILY